MKKYFLMALCLLGRAWAASEVEDFEAQQRLARIQQTLVEERAERDLVNQRKELENLSKNPQLGENNPQNNNGGKTEYERMQNEAFVNTVNQLLPMNPKQVKKLKEVYEESQAAMASPALVTAKPTSSSLLVDLTPNATPPVIRLGAGYISSLIFLDASGQPWPIDSYSLGDPVAFNIRWDQKGNTLLIQSTTFYKSSNLAVILKNLNTPVMITLTSGQDAIDYRVDLRVPMQGPNASTVYNGVINMPTSKDLLSVLNGVPPQGAKKITVKGGEAQAWKIGEDLYIRTKLVLLSPGWKAMIKSADGLYAYQLQQTTVVLASLEGVDKSFTLILDDAG